MAACCLRQTATSRPPQSSPPLSHHREGHASRSIVSWQLSQPAMLTTQALAPPETHEEKVSRQCLPRQMPSTSIASEWTASPCSAAPQKCYI